MKMPVIYVAGPYRAKNREAVELNIQSARKTGLICCLKGWSPIIPHANTGHMDQLVNLDDIFWLDATMELLRRADAMIICPGWERSHGTMSEIAEARRLGIPIYTNDNELPTGEAFLEKHGRRAG